MSQIRTIIGTGIPLTGDDIDTDRIIPARFLRCVTFDGLGEQVFADDRTQLQGRHPFDLAQYRGAKILVVNANFGCGSSREHAPQAILRWGIEGIVGESFAEIFFGNCIANGVPCVTASPEAIGQIQAILLEDPQAEMVLDLESLTVRCGQFSAPVRMDEGSHQSLLGGNWDTCAQLTQNTEEVKSRATQLPYLHWGRPPVSV